MKDILRKQRNTSNKPQQHLPARRKRDQSHHNLMTTSGNLDGSRVYVISVQTMEGGGGEGATDDDEILKEKAGLTTVYEMVLK